MVQALSLVILHRKGPITKRKCLFSGKHGPDHDLFTRSMNTHEVYLLDPFCNLVHRLFAPNEVEAWGKEHGYEVFPWYSHVGISLE